MPFDPAGEHLGAHAERTPDRPAVIVAATGEVRTYADVDDRSVRLARLFRTRGLRTGDHVALLVENRPEFFDVVWAANRAGLYVTPINWHLSPAEAGFVLSDCGAQAVVASARLGSVIDGFDGRGDRGPGLRLSVDGDLPGFEPIERALAAVESGPVPAEHDGGWMFYSSGTSGRPKGVVPPLPVAALGAPSFVTMMLGGLFGFDTSTVYLSPSPLYHAAPAGWTVGTHRIGGTVVLMERFDPVELLAAIETHAVTHLQLVPTHMVRLMKLSESQRDGFDLSSLRMVVHAAAPCPVEVKRSFLEWLGPIVHEYYSGTEGSGFCRIGPEEWLAHPGSVGRSVAGAIHVLGPDGDELAAGEEGEVWFETSHRFEYHDDSDATSAAWNERGWSWLGDVGRVDAEGYLYLTDRAGNMIISGGVNIYPREAEDVLVGHPSVADVGVIGTPDPDMGERVTAFVQLVDGATPGVTVTDVELVDWCRARLAHFKCPREVRFVDELPRLPTGKLLKRLLT